MGVDGVTNAGEPAPDDDQPSELTDVSEEEREGGECDGEVCGARLESEACSRCDGLD